MDSRSGTNLTFGGFGQGWRGFEVLVGWTVFLLLLVVIGALSAAVWTVGGRTGLVIGLVVAAATLVAYTRSSFG